MSRFPKRPRRTPKAELNETLLNQLGFARQQPIGKTASEFHFRFEAEKLAGRQGELQGKSRVREKAKWTPIPVLILSWIVALSWGSRTTCAFAQVKFWPDPSAQAPKPPALITNL